ncbi:MAG: DUF2157 domain-containing protein [Synechococcus sp. MED-G135]|nr:MAG: DUF2157 domain-containing protein [Synechococcus sp. MED-G135]
MEPLSDSVPAWDLHLQRWRDAGLIDDAAAASIVAWEQERLQGQPARAQPALTWPVRLLVLVGSLLLAAGVLLFVAAHWDQLSPLSRFGLLWLCTVAMHLAGHWFAQRLPVLSKGLHAVGTISLGAGVFLCAQIFNLEVNWSLRWGLLLWSLAAAAGWWLLRQGPQLVLLSLLLPGWLGALLALELERFDPEFSSWAGLPWVVSSVLLALTYFTAPMRPVAGPAQRVLLWVGGLLLPPGLIVLALAASSQPPIPLPSTWPMLLAWGLLLGLPMLLAWLLRRHRAWPLAVALVWILVDLQLQGQELTVLSFLWWGLGAIGLMAWGTAEARAERINFGTALFAITLMGFYIAEVMGRLERSLSLLGLGLLFLAGGWGLNRLRRSLLPVQKETLQ